MGYPGCGGMPPHILEYLIRFYREKFDKEGEYVKKWVPEFFIIKKNLFINSGSLIMKNSNSEEIILSDCKA